MPAFQPVTHSGRHIEFDPLTRLTNSDVIHLLAEQRPQWFQVSDFFPVPCCFPTCRSVTYLLTESTPDAPDFGVVPVPRLLDVEDYLDYMSNRVVPDYAIREALEKLWSASAFMGTDTTATRLSQFSINMWNIGTVEEAMHARSDRDSTGRRRAWKLGVPGRPGGRSSHGGGCQP